MSYKSNYGKGADAFELFWTDVCHYAKETGLSTQYLEEEFIIDGELIKVDPLLLAGHFTTEPTE